MVVRGACEQADGAASHAQMSGAWPAFVTGAGAPATICGLVSGVEVRVKSPLGLPQATAEPKPAKEEGVRPQADGCISWIAEAARPWLHIRLHPGSRDS